MRVMPEAENNIEHNKHYLNQYLNIQTLEISS
jgi:hypothetical protein